MQKQVPLLDGIYAGLDADGQAALFRVANGRPVRIGNEEWVRILDALEADMGELIVVRLSREPGAPPRRYVPK